MENSWEATDIKYYCNIHRLLFLELSYEQLLNMNTSDFLQSYYFCSTDIVQKHINNGLCTYKVPSCYEARYSDLFKRSIDTMPFSEAINTKLFIKPVSNNKEFDGLVVTNGLAYFYDRGIPIPNSDTLCYVSEIIIVLCEYRLLIGNKILYGKGIMKGEPLPIPQSFIEKVCECSPPPK